MNTIEFDVEVAATKIFAEIQEDIENGVVPTTVRDFSELHSYLDANDYLQCAEVPWGTDLPEDEDDPAGVRLVNAVTDRVNTLLADRLNGQTCQQWQWCGWCEGQPGGCEFCDGAGKRGCPCVVGDIYGRKWKHGTASGGQTCRECSIEIDAGTGLLVLVGGSAEVAHLECVSPAYGAAPVVKKA